jgi:hypothetical protein
MEYNNKTLLCINAQKVENPYPFKNGKMLLKK